MSAPTAPRLTELLQAGELAWREALAWRGGPHPGLVPIGIELLAVLRLAHRQEQQALLLPDLQRSLLRQDEASPWRARLQELTVAP